MIRRRGLPGRLAMILAACLLGLTSAPARGELIDRIAATVNDEVITARELANTIMFNQRISGTNDVREAETLQGIVTRRLLVQEARRLRFVDVSSQELSAQVAKLRERFRDDTTFNDFLADLDMTTAEIARLLEEKLLVERFIEKKVGLFVRVSRDDAQTYFDSHQERFTGKRFADVQKAIVKLLTDERIERQLDQYLTELRAKADIRILPTS